MDCLTGGEMATVGIQKRDELINAVENDGRPGAHDPSRFESGSASLRQPVVPGAQVRNAGAESLYASVGLSSPAAYQPKRQVGRCL